MEAEVKSIEKVVELTGLRCDCIQLRDKFAFSAMQPDNKQPDGHIGYNSGEYLVTLIIIMTIYMTM